uniref:Uncharacterized protein n=1 Tax=Glossina pallidipes TaxID=7398 RepID=A0A1A9ZMY9_GLOPL
MLEMFNLNLKLWYAAVNQCLYSLSVCFGNIIIYASYNKFGHNVHRSRCDIAAATLKMLEILFKTVTTDANFGEEIANEEDSDRSSSPVRSSEPRPSKYMHITDDSPPGPARSTDAQLGLYLQAMDDEEYDGS